VVETFQNLVVSAQRVDLLKMVQAMLVEVRLL
jgi:hypothetical protein